MIKLYALILAYCFPWSVFAQTAWTKVADERAEFNLTSAAIIRYGIPGKYIEQRLQAGQYLCGNALFTDPAPTIPKTCEAKSVTPPPVPKCYPYDALCDAGYSVTPKSIHYYDGAHGFYVYWWTQNASGKRNPEMFLLPSVKVIASAVFMAGLEIDLFGETPAKKKEIADSKWKSMVDYTCTLPIAIAKADDFGVMCSEAWDHRAVNLLPWTALMPPEPVWKVKPNGTTPDRPAYACTPSTAVPGGCIPGTTALKNVRATVGQLCKTDRPTAPSGTADLRTEFGPAFAPGVVTVCNKSQ